MAVSWAVQSRAQHPALLFAVLLAGLLIVWLYRSCGLSTDPGTDYMLLSVRTNPGVQLRMVPLVAVSTVLTHLCGGSAGRMGAALQMGGSISGALGHWARMDKKDCHIMTMCGMAAGFSALFGTPLTAAVFAMEVISVGEMYYAAFFPCLLSAFCSFLVTDAMGLPADAYQVEAGAGSVAGFHRAGGSDGRRLRSGCPAVLFRTALCTLCLRQTAAESLFSHPHRRRTADPADPSGRLPGV